jgi:hypothetical protein
MIKIKDLLTEKEESWSIKEKLPIKVKIERSPNGKYFRVVVPPMKMTYDTFQYLDNHHRPEDIDVSYAEYDYKNGKAVYVAGSVEDLDKWFKEYKKYVKPMNDYKKL